MQRTNIEYLTHTWNPLAMRCTPVSEGCRNCWHLRRADRMKNNPRIPEKERKAFSGFGRPILRGRELEAPMRAKKPAVIGVQFMGDLYHPNVTRAARGYVYNAITSAPWHTYLLLTKRSGFMLADIKAQGGGTVPDCVWPGVTITCQADADKHFANLLQINSKHLWVSIEPMLGPISLMGYLPIAQSDIRGTVYSPIGGPFIDAVILGGETGPGARPMHPDWVRSVRKQCAAAGVPFFFKGWGAWKGSADFKGAEIVPGTERKVRLLDGREHNDLAWGSHEE